MRRIWRLLRVSSRSFAAKGKPEQISHRQKWSHNNRLLQGLILLACFFVLFGLRSALISAAPALIGSRQVTPIIIDSFDVDQPALTRDTVGTDSSTIVGPSTEILGDERDLQIQLTAPDPPNQLISGVDNGLLSLEYGPNIEGSTRLQWDGNDGNGDMLNPTGLGGLDLTAGGTQDAFLLLFDFKDGQAAELIIEVFTDAGNSSTATITPGAIPPDGPDFVFEYNTDFVPNLGAGADFSNVGAITIVINSIAPAIDMQIDLFRTVSTTPPPRETPTPTSTPEDDDDDDEDDQAPPSAGTGGGGTGSAAAATATPAAEFPTTLPETGIYPINRWPQIVIGLLLVLGLGLLIRMRKSE